MTRKLSTIGEKGQALFLVAIMVLSVVAMSAAFTGAVAGDNHITIDRPDELDAEPGDELTYEVELNSDQEDIELFDEVSQHDELTIVDADSEEAQADVDEGGAVVLYPFSVDSDTVTITVEVDEDADPGSYTLEGTVVDADANEITGTTAVNVGTPADEPYLEVSDLTAPADVEPGEAVDVSATITNTGDDDAENADVELTLDGTVEDSTTVDLDAGDDTTVELSLTAPDQESSYTLGVETEHDAATQTLTVGEPEEPREEFTRQNIAGVDIWQGQVITVEGFDAGETVQLREGVSDDSDRVRFIQANQDGEVTIDTTDLDENPHFLRDEAGDDDPNWWVAIQDVEFEFQPDQVALSSSADSDLVFEDDNREEVVDVHISGELDGEALDADDLLEIFDGAVEVDDETVEVSDVSVGDEIAAEFEDIGEYEFTVDVTDSTAEDTADVEVLDEVVLDPDVEFGEIDNTAEGDIVEIPLNFEDAEAYGDDDVNIWLNESHYSAEITLDLSDFDDDSATLSWNTYYAGSADVGAEDGDVFSISSHDNATAIVQTETDINREDGFRLNPAGYTLGLFDDGGEFDNRIDSASATVTERHTGDASISIAPAEGAMDYEEFAHILGNETDSDEVASGDLLIIEQEITGIFGYLGSGDEHISVEFENTEAPAYNNPESFDETASHVSVEIDADAGAIYFIIDTSDRQIEPGDLEEWEYTFTVGEDNPYVSEDETSSDTYTVLPRMIGLDLVEEPYQITPTEDAEVHGTATVAPGTPVDVVIDRPGHFLDQYDPVVELNENGERVWSISGDYSDQSVDTEVDIYADAYGVSQLQWDGIFADEPEWETRTDAEQMRAILDELKDILNVDDDDDIIDAVEDLEADLEAAEDDIADLEAALADAEGDLDDAENEISDLEADLMEISTALEEAQDTIEAWQEAAGADTPDDVRDRIDELNAEISDLEGQISDLEGQISDLDGELSDANDRIDELEDLDDEWQSATGVDSPDDYDEDDDQPAFGPVAALIAILAGGALVAKRRFA